MIPQNTDDAGAGGRQPLGDVTKGASPRGGGGPYQPRMASLAPLGQKTSLADHPPTARMGHQAKRGEAPTAPARHEDHGSPSAKSPPGPLAQGSNLADRTIPTVRELSTTICHPETTLETGGFPTRSLTLVLTPFRHDGNGQNYTHSTTGHGSPSYQIPTGPAGTGQG